MPDPSLIERVRALVQAFLETDLARLRIEDANEDAIEVRRGGAHPNGRAEHAALNETPAPIPSKNLDAIKADLVGIVHFARPVPKEGEMLAADRELAHVEALGIRNPVRSLGPGRLVAIRCKDGQPVEYGQVLFEIDRHV